MEVHITKYGSLLKIKNGLIHIRVKEDIQQIPVHQVSKIFLNRSCRLTSELLFTSLENGIEVVLQKKNGDVAGRIWGTKFGSIATIRKNQLLFSKTRESREWIRDVLIKKIDHQIGLLLAIDQDDYLVSKRINETAFKLEEIKEKLKSVEFSVYDGTDNYLRAMEGNASKKYFRCISDVLPEQYRFKNRSRNPAKDMFNGMLNYSYGILYARVESALIRAGIDPAIGIFHADQYNRPAMVYDVIELFRTWADYVVVRLCMQEVVFSEFFDIPSGYYLNDSGKRILIQSFVDYFDETIWFDGMERSRSSHINLFAQKLATKLKEISNEEN